MSTGAQDVEAARLEKLYRAKARDEIESAEALLGEDVFVAAHGDELADVLLVKGVPGPSDVEAGRALAGADGEAAGKALDALGMPAARFFACTRPAEVDPELLRQRLRLLIEAVDPRTIVALDRTAGDDVAASFAGVTPASGVPANVGGRVLLIVDGLEASLADEAAKRRVWRQFKALGRDD
ncbi:MAG: hypothetical protein ISP10_01980 [Aeromicrobium sp.]|jgi:uracil-DNA glycosylase|nr:hypothetical protein [Aeromicrobium sp.]